MQTADSRLSPDLATAILPEFDQTGARRLLIQSDMRSVVVIVANILEAQTYQMSLVQRNHVIQHLAPYVAHPSFRESILPWTADTSPDSLDPARLQKRTHLGPEFAVTIEDDVLVWAWKRQRLSELLQNPLASRVRSRVEVENAPAMMLDE